MYDLGEGNLPAFFSFVHPWRVVFQPSRKEMFVVGVGPEHVGIAGKDKWIIQFVYRSINYSCGKPFWIDICFTWDLFATHLKNNNDTVIFNH